MCPIPDKPRPYVVIHARGSYSQSVAIFIAILGLVSLSSGFSLIVVMVLYIEREFVLYIDGFVLIVEGFGLFFLYYFGACHASSKETDPAPYSSHLDWIPS